MRVASFTISVTVEYRDRVAGEPLRTDAIWRIYSMTKVVVSVAALVLAERGSLRLDQPVTDFIPTFGNLRLPGPDGARVPSATLPTVQDRPHQARRGCDQAHFRLPRAYSLVRRHGLRGGGRSRYRSVLATCGLLDEAAFAVGEQATPNGVLSLRPSAKRPRVT